MDQDNMKDLNYLFSHLHAASLGRKDAPFAELATDNILTYASLFERVERLALTLVRLGVAPGDRVAAQIEKSISAIELYLATVMAGGVFLPLNTAYTSDEMRYFLDDAEPAFLICDPRNESSLRLLSADVRGRQVFTLGSDGSGSLTHEVAATPPGRFDSVARGKDDLAAMLYTSGTTGRSKGAMLSHGNLVSNAITLAKVWHFGPSDVLIHALPIFHTHGLFVATNVVLVSGASMIFHANFDASAIVAAMPRATVLMGVPTFYVRLLDQSGLTPEATAGMRLFISGSAPLLGETHFRWQAATGHSILERYGMTETNMNTSNPYDGERRPGSVGFPLPEVEIRITDGSSCASLPQGEIGAIEVKGPNVFLGYWQMPEKTAGELREDGFFKTGDIGVIDKDGYVSIVGRSKDLIISGGFNVYPKEVEESIDEIPGVRESAVIGVAHLDFGEAVVAVVVIEAGARLDERSIQIPLKGKLARYKQPKAIFFATELPRNTMGKVQKNLLRDTYKNTFACLS